MKAMRMIIGVWLIAVVCAVFVCAQQDWEAASKEAALRADWSKVAEAAQQWKQQNASTAVADWLLGYAGLATGDYNRAMAGFSHLADVTKARTVLDYASGLVDQNPKSAIAQMLKGDALARTGDYAAALTALNAALTALDKTEQFNSRRALIFDLRGVVRALAGKTEDALSDFDQAIGLDPKLADAHANLGLVLLAAGSPSGAVESLTQALDLAPNFALAYNGRGVAYALMEAWDEAESDFKKAAEIAPGLPFARGNAQFIIWGKGQVAFRQSLQDSAEDGRGSTLIAQSFDHRVVDVGDGTTMDVFIIKPTPQTSTLEGMKSVVQEFTRQLRIQNGMPDTWQPRFHLDAHGFNSTPYANDQMSFATKMTRQAGRDALIMMDFSPWYKGTGPLGSLPNALTWRWNVTEAAEQLARANAAINVITGNKTTFTGYSGGGEAWIKMGEILPRQPLEVSRNVGFDVALIFAYPACFINHEK